MIPSSYSPVPPAPSPSVIFSEAYQETTLDVCPSPVKPVVTSASPLASAVSIVTPPLKLKDREPMEPRPAKPRLTYGSSASLVNPVGVHDRLELYPGSALTPGSSLQALPLNMPYSAPFSLPSATAFTFPISAIKHSSISRANTPLTDHTEDFAIPAHTFTPVPPAPSVLPSYPKTQREVHQDFSKAKAPPNQVPIHQFQNWVNDNYLRSFGEDDLAFLSGQALSSEQADGDLEMSLGRDGVFIIPSLGSHYSEVWREEDVGIPLSKVAETDEATVPHPLAYPPLQPVKLEEVTDVMLSTEKMEVGPLTERVISTIQPLQSFQKPDQESTSGSRRVDEPRDINGVSTWTSSLESTLGVKRLVDVDSAVLEKRMMKELRYLGVLNDDEEVSADMKN